MAERPPESILPPPPRIPRGIKSALVALVITIPLVLIGVHYSFYLTHGASFAEIALTIAVYWPALIPLALLGAIEAPGFLISVACFGAEFLYVWGIVRLVVAIAHARQRA